MKKIVLPLFVIFALVLAACAPAATPTQEMVVEPTEEPVVEQTPEPTEEPEVMLKDIVDTAVADGRFTTLVTAVTEAGLVETLKGEGPFTVFAPTDEAFAALPAGTVEGLLADIPALTNVLLYHVVPGKVMAADVVALDGKNAPTALEGKEIGISLDGNMVKLNENVSVIITDIETYNGVIHVIDAVLLPPAEMMDIVDTAVADGRFTTLVDLLTASNLVETLKGDGPFTVFAPTDEAFAKLDSAVLESLAGDITARKNALLYHVVPGKVMASDVIGLDDQMVDTALEGKQLSVKVDGEMVKLNENVGVIITDIETSNGVIHVIDAVLLPPMGEMSEKVDDRFMNLGIAEALAMDGRFVTLVSAVTAADLVATLQGEGPFTVFAPTDEAFAALPAGTVEGLLADIPALTNVLLYHVVPGKVMAADVIALDGQMVETALEGKEIKVTVKDGNVYLNDEVMVIITDIETTNGVIHVIDAVLLPPAE